VSVWFDISNSPHVNIFKALIRDLESEHEVVITARPLANTVELLDLYGLSYEVVGRHYGASKLRKAWGYPVRVAQLYGCLRGRRPDVAISHSSFHSPLVARLLGIPSIYMNDNEHTLGNVPACLSASRVLIPEFLDPRAFRRLGASPRKLAQYPGVKEGFYLSHAGLSRSQALTSARPRIYLRPEPWTALYYDGAVGFLDGLLEGLAGRADVVLLPRGADQAERYGSSRFDGVDVASRPIPLEDIVPACDLFIGAGGTMTREMAVMGVPTISVYQSDLLAVDRHLIEIGAMIHDPGLTADKALAHLNETGRRPPDERLLEKGRAAYALVKETLLDLGRARSR
jgi:predicted glycosyltransferase